MKQSKNKKLAQAKADKWFSLYIRTRDSVNGIAKCCTCGRYVSEFDCGHFLSRRFEATRYDERNAHAQCLKCNRFENGNQFAHGEFIDQKYGKGTSQSLLMKSRMVCKRTQQDYEFIAQEFKSKMK
jgi:hypothetical protein